MDTSGILYPRYTDISQILLVRRKAECLATDLCKVPFDRLDEVLLPQDKKDLAQERPKKERKKEKRKQPPEGEKAPESKVGA